MRRTLLLFAAMTAALLLPATPAAAHGGEAPDATSYRVTVLEVTPPEPGLRVEVIEGGARLELTNDTGRTVEVLGYAGEPYLEVRADGTYENMRSPSTYQNRTLAGDTPVPDTADPTAPPQWRRVSTGTTARWHDQRVQWRGEDPPQAAADDPTRTHRLRTWAVPLREQARIMEIRGELHWVPPPRAEMWWVGTLLLAAAVAGLGRWRPALIAPLALVAGIAVIGYGVARTLDSGVSVVLFAAGLVAVAAAFWRPPFFTALAGVVLAAFGGVADAGVFRAAVVPMAGPSWLARVAVLAAIGVGAGMAVTGLLRLRNVSEPEAKVEA